MLDLPAKGGAKVVDNLALVLSHGLLFYAMYRLMRARDPDDTATGRPDAFGKSKK
jgi:hypothetical protein